MSDQSSVRFLVFPALLVLALFAFSFNTTLYKKSVPNVALFSKKSHSVNANEGVDGNTTGQSSTTVVTSTVMEAYLQVDSVSKAFQLGRLYQEYKPCLHHWLLKPNSECWEIEKKLGNLTQLNELKVRQLLSLETIDVQLYESYLKKAAGFVTITNCAMVVGALLMATAIGPILFIGLKCLLPLIQKCIPTIEALIEMIMPFFEVIAYCVSFIVCSQSIFYDSSVSHYVAFFGGLLSVMSFFYSTFLHAPKKGGREQDFAALLGGYVVLVFSPLAIVYQSTLLGFCACCGLYSALGFSIIPNGLCTAIGFDSKNSLERCASTSLLFIVGSMMVPHLSMTPEFRAFLEPFRFGIFSLGGTVYFLATLIVSSSFYEDARKLGSYSSIYWTRQIYFLLPLMTFFCIGNIYTIPSLVNTAGTFFFIYFMEKYTELMWKTEHVLFWILTLVAGVILWVTALFLKTHPDWIVLMFVPL